MTAKEELDAAFEEYERRRKQRDEIRAALRRLDAEVDDAVQRMLSASWRVREEETQ